MANLFRSVKAKRIKRNPFNLSHDVKLSTDFGRLTPILCKEVVPGDTFRLRSEMLIRTAPLYAPLMHRVNAYVHYFYVPSRIIMDDFDVFISGGAKGDGRKPARFDRTGGPYIQKPFIKLSEILHWYRTNVRALFELFGNGSLFDYLGFPALSYDDIRYIQVNPDVTLPTEQLIDLLPFKAYQLIYNEYYRDQNFEDEVDILKDVNGDTLQYLLNAQSEGAQNVGTYIDRLMRTRTRNWEKDYFTSSLPWPQRGGDTTIGTDADLTVNNEVTPEGYLSALEDGKVSLEDVTAHIYSHVGVTGTVSINELRRALAVQKFRERLARYGSRYTEFLRGMFGVRPSDARLQRPEFLGGLKQEVAFGEVLQTSQTTEQSPQGAYAGTGFSLSGGKYIKARFVEHGYIIGILSIMPKPAYMQGWPREFQRFDKLDYYLPDFANIGEQTIHKSELAFSCQADPHLMSQTFGYIPRYAEYKFAPSRVCGEMRSSLDFWHLARRIQIGQNLNASFLEVNRREMDRVFNYVGNEDESLSPSADDHFWLQVYHDIKAVRPMPKFGTPLL